MIVAPKPFWKSKVFYFNLSVVVVSFAWPYLKGYVTPEQAGLLVGAANLVLRYFTQTPVTLTGDEK